MEEAWELAVVITSAASLHSALLATVKVGGNYTFAKAVMVAVGNPEGNESEAFLLMTELYKNLHADIQVAFSDKLRATLTRSANTFHPLTKFSTYDQKIQNLVTGSNFLNEPGVDSLLMLDAALQGKCERPKINFDEDVLEAFTELRDVVAELELPDSISQLMEKRIQQLERAARDFSFYGISGLTKSIEELMGAIEVHVEAKAQPKKSYKKFRTVLIKSILTVTGAVAATNVAISETKELADHVEAAVALIPDFSGIQDDNPSGDTEEIE